MGGTRAFGGKSGAKRRSGRVTVERKRGYDYGERRRGNLSAHNGRETPLRRQVKVRDESLSSKGPESLKKKRWRTGIGTPYGKSDNAWEGWTGDASMGISRPRKKVLQS